MIKTLGPLEDAPDLDSIAPVLQNWADLIRHNDNAVSQAFLVTLLYADTHCSWLFHLMSMSVLLQVQPCRFFALVLHCT